MAPSELLNQHRVLFEYLREIGCCKRCSLRHLGEKGQTSYRHVDDVLKQKGLVDVTSEENGSKAKVFKSNPCIACLGLLEDDTIADTVKKVSDDVLQAQYDCDYFTCAMSLPIAIILRAYSLWLHLVECFPVPFAAPDADQETCITPLKEAWKWSVGYQIAKSINKELDSGATCDFFIEINMVYSDEQAECNCLLEMHPDTYKIRAKQKRKYNGLVFTRKAVETTLLSTQADHFKKHCDSPPSAPAQSIRCETVVCVHNAIYIAGRYNKFSRTLSQTPWVIHGERMMESSVQEIICDEIQKTAKAEAFKFSSSGREDVDVRMLGRGRPFVCELVNPRHVKLTDTEIRHLEKTINAASKDVAIRDLQLITKDQLNILKTGEEEKTKTYLALCVCRDVLTQARLDQLRELKDVALKQLTPIRVLHRRPLATRVRMIHSMEAHLQTAEVGSVFKLDLTTQAGTYVKEFVHGDFGRTKPNLGEILGCEVDIIALDVEEIELDWPPRINYEEGGE